MFAFGWRQRITTGQFNQDERKKMKLVWHAPGSDICVLEEFSLLCCVKLGPVYFRNLK